MKIIIIKFLRCLFIIILFICFAVIISPVQAASIQTVLQNRVLAKVDAGLDHSALINYDGQVYLWGDNTFGQLGKANIEYSDEPMQVLFPDKAVDISLGSYHTLVLLENGDVYSFGRNTFGQLGDGTTEQADRPVKIEGLSGIRAVSAGALHSMALGEDGSVWSWGNNTHLQVGDVFSETIYDANGTLLGSRYINPTRVVARNATAIAAGGQHSLYLDSQGIVYAWGDNSRGQLGNGSSQMDGRPGVVAGLDDVRLIAAGYLHSLAVNKSQERDVIWAWGDDTHGQLGIGSDLQLKPYRSLPVSVEPRDGSGDISPLINQISAGYAHSAAIVYRFDEDGRVDLERHQLWFWGNNSHGQLGISSSGNSINRPVLYSGTYYNHYGNHFLPLDSLAAGGYHTLLLSSKGLLAAAGRGDNGQLGNISILDRNQFVNVTIPDVIRPAFLPGSGLTLEPVSETDYMLRWPKARDNKGVSGYQVIITGSDGASRTITVDEQEYVLLSDTDPELAYEIIVAPFDSASARIRWPHLSRLVTYLTPKNGLGVSEYFENRQSSLYQAMPFAHNWRPDKYGNVQALDVPWKTTAIYGEDAIEPPGSCKPLLITLIFTLLLMGIIFGAVYCQRQKYQIRKPDINLTVDTGSQ